MKKNSYLIFLLITSIASILLTIYFNNSESYRFIFILPLSYMLIAPVLLNYFHVKKYYHYGVIYYFSQITIYLRYVITPISIIFSQYNRIWIGKNGSGWGPDPQNSSINYAIILMVLELFFIYIAQYLGFLFSSKKNRIHIKNEEYEFLKNKDVLFVFIIATFLFLIVVSPQIFSISSMFILDEDYSKNAITFQFEGLVTLLFFAFKIAVLLWIYSMLYKKYKRNHSLKYIVGSFIMLIIFLGINTSTSRWNLLFPAIASISIFFILYPKVPKSFIAGVSVILVISIISISMYKFRWTIFNSNSPIQDIFSVLLSQFQDYFSGPRLIAQTIEMNNFLGDNITASTLVNDIFGNVPGMANLINQNDRINSYFNYYNFGYWGHRPLIIPMLGEGMIRFPIFPFIFTAICEYLVIIFDNKAQNTNVVEYKFIYMYMGFFIGMCVGFNTQIIWGHVFSLFLPCMLLFFVNRKFVFRKRKYI